MGIHAENEVGPIAPIPRQAQQDGRHWTFVVPATTTIPDSTMVDSWRFYAMYSNIFNGPTFPDTQKSTNMRSIANPKRNNARINLEDWQLSETFRESAGLNLTEAPRVTIHQFPKRPTTLGVQLLGQPTRPPCIENSMPRSGANNRPSSEKHSVSSITIDQ